MNELSTNPAWILVMEDNPADIYLLRHALDQHRAQYRLEVLADGEAALRFVQDRKTSAAQPEPCVIVLDLHLPKHDGKTVLEAMRRESSLPGVAVVAWTSFAAPTQEDEVRNLGVRLCIRKPTDLDEWISLAGQILGICREQGERAFA